MKLNAVDARFGAVFPAYFDCGHFWSLALEEEFHSIWPLVVFFVRKPHTLIRVGCVGILMALSLRIAIGVGRLSPSIAYYGLPMHMDSLLAGALLAQAVRDPSTNEWVKLSRLRLVFWAFLVLLTVVLSLSRTFHWSSVPMSTVGYSLLAAMFAAIIAAALVPGTIATFIGRIPLFRFFGKYSYGLYVWHAAAAPVTRKWLVYFQHSIRSLLLRRSLIRCSFSGFPPEPPC